MSIGEFKASAIPKEIARLLGPVAEQGDVKKSRRIDSSHAAP